MFRKLIVGLVLALPILISCTSPSQEADGPPLSTDEFIEELQRVSKPGYSYCIFLRNELTQRKEIPELIQCNDDEDPTSGDRGIVVAFADPTPFYLENNIEITYDVAFAPLDAMANAFDAIGADEFTSVDLFLVFFDDLCGNTWEVNPSTLARLGAGDISLEDAMSEVDLYSAPDCL